MASLLFLVRDESVFTALQESKLTTTGLAISDFFFPQPETIRADKHHNALFHDTLKDIYYAEKQIYKSLPKMAKAANSNQLRAAFEKHHDETEGTDRAA